MAGTVRIVRILDHQERHKAKALRHGDFFVRILDRIGAGRLHALPGLKIFLADIFAPGITNIIRVGAEKVLEGNPSSLWRFPVRNT